MDMLLIYWWCVTVTLYTDVVQPSHKLHLLENKTTKTAHLPLRVTVFRGVLYDGQTWPEVNKAGPQKDKMRRNSMSLALQVSATAQGHSSCLKQSHCKVLEVCPRFSTSASPRYSSFAVNAAFIARYIAWFYLCRLPFQRTRNHVKPSGKVRRERERKRKKKSIRSSNNSVILL